MKLLLLGSGELGKEVAIEAMRLGHTVVACDRYANAPAMQVAHSARVFSMLDGTEIRRAVEEEKPDLIVPEIEAIATATLVELEQEGHTVIPTARAAQLTMDREGIRRLAAEELKLSTSPYRFAGSFEELEVSVSEIGFPCVIKPTMSSSGKGQSVVRSAEDLPHAWEYAMEAGRGKTGKVIVEGFIDFDYEITLLTVRHAGGTSFCAPIGHVQIDGDYRESWQPHTMSDPALMRAKEIGKKITDALGGRGLFGVELFVKGDEVIFSEVSPRPHDTGMVTMVSQNMSEFELHVRAITGLPIPEIVVRPGASVAVLSSIVSDHPVVTGVAEALTAPGTSVRVFGKPSAHVRRRMAVALALGNDTDEARKKAHTVAEKLEVTEC
ncbi:MAG: formate-dependent phosphoribosylglycinamide formyltransferase [Patescibacteria group bacterium]